MSETFILTCFHTYFHTNTNIRVLEISCNGQGRILQVRQSRGFGVQHFRVNSSSTTYFLCELEQLISSVFSFIKWRRNTCLGLWDGGMWVQNLAQTSGGCSSPRGTPKSEVVLREDQGLCDSSVGSRGIFFTHLRVHCWSLEGWPFQHLIPKDMDTQTIVVPGDLKQHHPASSLCLFCSSIYINKVKLFFFFFLLFSHYMGRIERISPDLEAWLCIWAVQNARSVVLRLELHQYCLKGSLKHRFLGLTPKVSDSVGLGWDMRCTCLTTSQVKLVLMLMWLV